GEIFYFFTDELADITFGESFQIIITAMIESISAIFQPTEEQLAMFIEMFVGQLPEYIRNSLAKAGLAA
ncbi:MAG: transposase, partial [Bilifractor sp.]|nr:transposase [Bilifractor sp.]